MLLELNLGVLNIRIPPESPVFMKGAGGFSGVTMESLFSTIKTESLHHYRFSTREEAKLVVFEYIEVFYNRIRRHSKINNTAPATYAAQFQSTLQQLAA